MVGVVVFVVGPLRVHVVAFAGSDQVVGVVEKRGVQRVGVDQTDQVLSVVFAAQSEFTSFIRSGRSCFRLQMSNRFRVPSRQSCVRDVVLTRRVRPGPAESVCRRASPRADLLPLSAPSRRTCLRHRGEYTKGTHLTEEEGEKQWA